MPADPMRSHVTLTSLLFILANCGGTGPLTPNLEANLTRMGGCVDVLFFAVDQSDELMLSFRAEGAVSEAQASGEETVTVFELPSPAAELILERGTRVSDATCDDVLEGDGPQVHRTWSAVSGTATVHVRPGTSAEGARADLFLEDVVLETVDGDEVGLDELEWTDVHVGWYPG